MSKKEDLKITRTVATRKNNEYEYRTINYDFQGSNEAIASIAEHWGYDGNDQKKMKSIDIDYGEINEKGLNHHKNDITPLMESDNQALLCCKDEDKSVEKWSQQRIQIMTKYNVVFDDQVDFDAEFKLLEAKNGEEKDES